MQHAVAFFGAVRDLIPAAPMVADLGSGGGIPGLVLAEAMPTARITLVESRSGRSGELRQAIEELGWSNRVVVYAGRAETAGRALPYRGQSDLVVARGFAAPGVTAECAAPLLRVGGLLCVSEPPGDHDPNRWPEGACSALGLRLERTVRDPFAFVVLRQAAPCPDAYPRRVGIPGKRPLF